MRFLDFLFPKRCVGCGKIGAYFCNQCRRNIRVVAQNEAICPVCEKLAIDGATHLRCQTRYTPDGLTSFFRYDGAVRKAIKSLKYRHVSDLASEFISLVPNFNSNTRIPGQARNDNKILIPIPLHPSRFKERGFNQAEVLGAMLGNKLHISQRLDILMRTKKTEPQVSLRNRKERVENMYDVFGISPIFDKKTLEREKIKELRGKHIMLFDDVFTTGATMRAAASTLKHAGVQHVWAVTMAR